MSEAATAESILTFVHGVQSGTAVRLASPYYPGMRTEYLKAAVIAAWVLAVGVLGFAFGATSMAAWAGLAAIAVVLPAVMLRLWHAPVPSMSESIHDVID